MRRLLRRNFKEIAICLLILFGLFILAYRNSYKPADTLPNVIIMTFEGVRNSETIGDPMHQYIPNIWNNLRREGTLYTNLAVANCEFHMSSVQAINTGDNYEATWGILHPTLFHYVKKSYKLPQHKLWMIAHWYKFSSSLAFSSNSVDNSAPCAFTSLQPDEDYKNRKLREILSVQEKEFILKKRMGIESKVTKWPVWDSMSGIYHTILMKILRIYKPKLVHYLLAGPECAHYGSYARYVVSIKDADEQIAEVWELIKKDPFYKDNTYFFVTADHSRDAYYCRHNKSYEPVWLYVFGPGIKQNTIIQRPVYHIDIFSTVAYLMKVKTHETKGKILLDCFVK